MANTEQAIFAGGCFWCTEAEFAGLEGVVSVMPGYTGGHVENPTYEQVCSKQTGHHEAILVTYDPAKISYEALLDIFWRSIDPTDPGGQFYDRGEPYHTAIFTSTEAQLEKAKHSKEHMQMLLGNDIYTKILPAQPFYPAEEYHHQYYQKNALHYKAYKQGSGREDYLQRLWKK